LAFHDFKGLKVKTQESVLYENDTRSMIAVHNFILHDNESSASVKDIFERVTDAWSLKCVHQRENCESQ